MIIIITKSHVPAKMGLKIRNMTKPEATESRDSLNTKVLMINSRVSDPEVGNIGEIKSDLNNFKRWV